MPPSSSRSSNATAPRPCARRDAIRLPSPVAANTTLPAVASTPAASEPRLILYSHLVSPVSGSMALMPAVDRFAQTRAATALILPALFELLRGAREALAGIRRLHVHPTRRRTVRRRLKIGAAAERRIHRDAALRPRIPTGNHLRPAVRIEARVPGHAHERSPCEKRSVGPVQNIEHSVAVGLHQQLARLAVEHAIHQHHVLGRVPIVAIAGRELVMPFARPVAGSSASTEQLNRLSPLRTSASISGPGLPTVQYSVSRSGS